MTRVFLVKIISFYWRWFNQLLIWRPISSQFRYSNGFDGNIRYDYWPDWSKECTVNQWTTESELFWLNDFILISKEHSFIPAFQVGEHKSTRKSVKLICNSYFVSWDRIFGCISRRVSERSKQRLKIKRNQLVLIDFFIESIAICRRNQSSTNYSLRLE